MKTPSVWKTALVLICICSLCAALVAGVNTLTADRIAEGEKQALKDTIYEIFPEAAGLVQTPLDCAHGSVQSFFSYTDAEGKTVAYAAVTTPKGFQDQIRMCVVLTDDGEILGVRVLSNSETPGLGERACEDSYLDGYKSLSGTLAFGEGVDAISGATVSSRAVLTAVNEVLELHRSLEKGGAV